MNKPSGQPRVCHLLALFLACLLFPLALSLSLLSQSVTHSVSQLLRSCNISIACCQCVRNYSSNLLLRQLQLHSNNPLLPMRLPSRSVSLAAYLCPSLHISHSLSHTHCRFCVPIFTAFWRFLLSTEKEFCCSTSTLSVKYSLMNSCTYPYKLLYLSI